jgi:hypothetical protein
MPSTSRKTAAHALTGDVKDSRPVRAGFGEKKGQSGGRVDARLRAAFNVGCGVGDDANKTKGQQEIKSTVSKGCEAVVRALDLGAEELRQMIARHNCRR